MTKKKKGWTVVKVNVSMNAGIAGVGVFLVSRDDVVPGETFMMEHLEYHQDVKPRNGERLSILRGLEIASEHGASRVKIRSNYKQTRTRLKRYHRFPGASFCRASASEHEILRLAVTAFREVKFAWVARKKNSIATRLARQGLRKGRFEVYGSEVGVRRHDPYELAYESPWGETDEIPWVETDEIPF